jgi:hypothetical protein
MVEKKLLFNAVVTVALLLPCVGANAFQEEVSRSRKVAAQHTLALPDLLEDGWVRRTDSSDITEREVVTRVFVDSSGDEINVLVRQAPLFQQIHDFTDCLIANGKVPVFDGTVTMITPRGRLCASRIVSTKSQYSSLLWFQDDAASAPDKWAWRWRLLTNRGNLPICREVRLVKKCSPDPRHDLETLKRIALSVYAVPL